MPVREIKTTLKLDGEKEFKKELADASREMRVLDAALKASAAEFKAGGTAQDYYTKRSQTLNNQIRQQQEIIDALTRKVSGNADAINDTSAAMDGYRIKLSNATAKMFDLRREAEAASRELEELGRDSGKAGRQIEDGIGDAAEDAAEKVSRMFAGVTEDIEAIKGSFAVQTTMSVGEFVVDAVGSVVDFVNDNQELNRQISIARHNIEKYDLNWEEVQALVIRASAITGNQDGALEAVSNLAAAGFDSEEILRSAMDALLGVFLTTGGSLSFESLAEDFRASVVSKTPTGTYAEVIEEVLKGVAIDEVEKALQATQSTEEAIQVALSYLTSGGMQSEVRSYEEQNRELIETQIKMQQLSLAWAALADELSPITQAFVGKATEIVTALADAAEGMKKLISGDETAIYGEGTIESAAEQVNRAIEEYYTDETNRNSFGRWWADLWNITPDKYKVDASGISIIPSAGAEEMPAEWGTYGENAVGAIENGMITAASESTVGTDIMKGIISQMSAEDANALIAGQNSMTQFANGVAEGSTAAISNVADMVNQINALLAQVGSVAYGAGFAATGGGVDLTVDGNDLSTVVSTNLGRKTQATLLVK